MPDDRDNFLSWACCCFSGYFSNPNSHVANGLPNEG
jgi:hypothetical protein